MVEGKDCEGALNSCNLSRTKRVIEDLCDESEVNHDDNSDFLCGNTGKRKIRVLETVDEKSRASKSIGIHLKDKENEEIESLKTGDKKLGFLEEKKMGEEETENTDRLRELEKVGPSFGFDGFTVDVIEVEINLDLNVPVLGAEFGASEKKLDLNMPVFDVEFGGIEMGIPDYNQVRPVIAERSVEVVVISSDESEDEGLKLVSSRGDKGKANVIDNESNPGLDLDLGTLEIGQATDHSSLAIGGRRYTREEKGKGKLVHPWLSLANNSLPYDFDKEEQINFPVSGLMHLGETLQLMEQFEQGLAVKREQEMTLKREQEMALKREQEMELKREEERRAAVRRLWEAEEKSARLRTYRRFALPQEETISVEPSKKEQEVPSTEFGIDLEFSSSPFYTALKVIRDRNSKQRAQQLIEWKHSDRRILKPLLPSLLDLSLKILAHNIVAIVSLEAVPDELKWRLSNLLCDSRKMNIHTLDLFLRGSPTEIRVKDCSWITEDQFTESFGSLDPRNLRVLQLDLCGQCVLGDVIAKTLARSSDSLPGLAIISLRGACRLTDDALEVLVKLAPQLCSLNLGQCSLLTSVGIDVLANSLRSSLREFYIDYCHGINVKHITLALKKFEHLEVLSVAGIQTVSDRFITGIITAFGRNMKDLDLADCPKLTNNSLKVIGETCSELRALNISNLHKLTDDGLLYLANGCRSIQTLKLCHSGFSDEAIAAFLEVCGGSLEELSLNHVSKVSSNTAFSLAKCSRKLINLDLSWCRRVTDEALGLIVDSCLSLKLLKLFGCTQITDVFLNGHSNSLVQIIGLNLTSIVKVVCIHEADVLLRYSPLPDIFESQTADHQDV